MLGDIGNHHNKDGRDIDGWIYSNVPTRYRFKEYYWFGRSSTAIKQAVPSLIILECERDTCLVLCADEKTM